ncbi:MAG: type II toxin-antitoxin system HipA family toxin [Casimicrobiaceae bacterium]
MPYQLTDELFLWWLANTRQPALIGTLQFVRSLAGVSLQYAESWLRGGFALSEDLPLTPNEHFPSVRETAAGAVDDARPDRWGERVIRFIEKPPRLSVLEYLYYAGDRRFGALGVSASAEAYQPHSAGPLPQLEELEDIHDVVRRVEANEPVPEAKRRLITPGATMGGARPKAMVEMDGAQYVLKFAEHGEATDAPLIEHAALTLAERAGIHVATTRAVPLRRGHAITVRRFDRQLLERAEQRVHAQSALVALRAEGTNEPGYPELAQLLRRRGPMASGTARAQMRELYRRMVFNILIDNTDDHEKNHVLLMDAERRHLLLAPAFDVLPTGQSLGYQQMRVGKDGHDATLTNALSESALFGLKQDEAQSETVLVAKVCAAWKAHFRRAGVTERDIELLAQSVDRASLASQRDEYARATVAGTKRKRPAPR